MVVFWYNKYRLWTRNTINTTDFGLGSHTFKLITSDILGNSEIIYFSILVYSEISTNDSFYTMHLLLAIKHCRDNARLCVTHQKDKTTTSAVAKTPLMLYQFDLVDTSDGKFNF